jgi:hypothetical protein
VSRTCCALGVDGQTRLESGGTLRYGVRAGNIRILDRPRPLHLRLSEQHGAPRLLPGRSTARNPQLPVVSLTHIATGQNGLFGPLADRKLANLRFTESSEDETDLTANLDYSFALPLAGQAIDWKVGVKTRSKDRSSRPRIVDVNAPTTGTVPTFADFPGVHRAARPPLRLAGDDGSDRLARQRRRVLPRQCSRASRSRPWLGDELIRPRRAASTT